MRRVLRWSLRALGVLAALIVALIAFGFWLAHQPDPPPIVATTPAERRELNLKVFDEAWTQVDRHYFDQTFNGLDWEKVRVEARPQAAAAKDTAELYNVLWSMLDRLGTSHVMALHPTPVGKPEAAGDQPVKDAADYGARFDAGMGLKMAFTSHGAFVTDVLKDSPPEKLGVEPGWGIANARISPKPGAGGHAEFGLVTLELAELTIAYDFPLADPPPARAAYTLPSGVRVLRFDGFDDESADWLIKQLQHAPAAGVVIDLRQNPGGRVRATSRALGALLPPSSVIGTDLKARRKRLERTGRDRPLYVGPLAVLIGPASSSGAEIMADALRFQRRGVLVGERTAGKVLTSRNYRLPDGGLVQVAISDFRGPAGKRIEGVGVEPDVFARETLAAIRADRDLVVEAADAALARQR